VSAKSLEPLGLITDRLVQPATFRYRWHLPKSAAFAIYLAVAIFVAALPILAHPATRHIGFGSDPSVMMWCLVWWPHAVAHGLNPLISRVIWEPGGFNLSWATSIPALAFALWPITSAFGPVVAYNLAAVLAPVLAAFTAFLLCRKLTAHFSAALVGGGIYGFSPYEMGHLIGGHLSLTFTFVPPLCVLLFLLLLDGSIGRGKFTLGLAALLIVQCLLSSEILATMTIVAAASLLGGFVLLRSHRRALLASLGPLAAGYLLAAIALTPFFYAALANHAAPRKPLFPASFFSADLLGFAVPTQLLLIAPARTVALTSRFTGNLAENEFYLGLPLLFMLGWFFWSRRSQPPARLLLLMLMVVCAMALGPMLHVAGHPIGRMAWSAFFDLPLIRNALPVRFANYGFLLAAMVVSICWAAPGAKLSRVAALYAMAALLPKPLLLQAAGYRPPPFFSAGLYRKLLHPGENIVTFPYGVNGPSMLWQAESGMYFSMAGGYIGPTPDEFARWPAVNSALFLLPLTDAENQWHSFLVAHKVGAIVIADGAIAPPIPLANPIRVGGVSVYRIGAGGSVSAAQLDSLELSAAQQWTGMMLHAALRFLDRGGNPSQLNPRRLHALGLLPDSKWAARLDWVFAGTSHGAITGLWVGPGSDRTLAVGLFASPKVAAALAARYRKGATAILYPYPAPYREGPTPDGPTLDGEINFLLMTIRPEFLRRATDP